MECGLDLRTKWVGGCRAVSLRYKSSRDFPRGLAEKGTGIPGLKSGSWGGSLDRPRRGLRLWIPLPHSKPVQCCSDRRPARGRQAAAPARSWPHSAAWARAVTRKHSGSGSGVSAGRMAADTQVRRAAVGPTRPASGCGRRLPGRTSRAASLEIRGAAAAEGAALRPPRSGSSRPRLPVRLPAGAAQTDFGLESGTPAWVWAAGAQRGPSPTLE